MGHIKDSRVFTFPPLINIGLDVFCVHLSGDQLQGLRRRVWEDGSVLAIEYWKHDSANVPPEHLQVKLFDFEFVDYINEGQTIDVRLYLLNTLY
jgi:hypothetical protein